MTQLKGRLFRYLIGVPAVLAFAAVSPAADDSPDASTAKIGTQQSSSQNPEVQELKRQLAEQQKQIDELRMILLGQKKQIDTVTNAVAAPSAPAVPAATGVALPASKGIGEVASITPVLPPVPIHASLVPPLPQATTASEPNPLQIKIGEATIQPVGFMDLTNTFRSTNAGTSLQTNFGSIPYTNTIPGRLTEDKLSAANSRIGFRVDALFKDIHILGYYEGDFVGGVAGNNTQVSSNSLLYRIRLYWVDLRKNKLEFLAGQSWSMMTPNRKQISALPGDLFYSQVVDVNYMNGLTWGRVPGMRILYHPSEKVTFGLSAENGVQYFGGSGGGGLPTLPASLATPIGGQVDENVANGITAPNVHPDFIGKVAFDPSSRVHFELAGVVSSVRLWDPLTNEHNSKTGGGGSVNGNFEIFPGFRLVTNNFWSDGEGRYLFGVAPDFIVRADGSPSLIHSGSTVSGFEYAHKNTQIYAYYGGIFIGKNTALDADGKTKIGYGYAGSANSQNKTTQEGTGGLTQTLFRDPKYGAVQMMFQYAYFFRNPWNIVPGTPRNAHESAVWFNLRYTLPGAAPAIKY
jgi:hypothetical protein